MAWIQLQFTIAKKKQKALENALEKVGVLSLTYQDAADQPILEPELYQTPMWDSLVLSALFEASVDIKKLLPRLESFYGQSLPEHKIEILEDKDWVREWMENYQPIQMSDKLWICPSWKEPPNKNAINLMLDPGLAFGTGTHPTTAMCLKQLSEMHCVGKSVIDYGCGSGILAVAAMLLGAKSAIGVDIDPQALTASRDNAEKNHIPAELFEVYLPNQQPKALKADIVLANILAGPLVELAADLMAMLESGGQIVLSGLLVEQQAALEAAFDQVTWQKVLTQEQWLCLYGVKKQNGSQA